MSAQLLQGCNEAKPSVAPAYTMMDDVPIFLEQLVDLEGEHLVAGSIGIEDDFNVPAASLGNVDEPVLHEPVSGDSAGPASWRILEQS